MTSSVIKSHAKINLSLGVIEKSDSEYHKIESLISFLKFYDEISIEKIKNKSHKVEFFGKFVLTKLNEPTKQLLPISLPLSTTTFGAIQQPTPILTLPEIIVPAAICENFFIIAL